MVIVYYDFQDSFTNFFLQFNKPFFSREALLHFYISSINVLKDLNFMRVILSRQLSKFFLLVYTRLVPSLLLKYFGPVASFRFHLKRFRRRLKKTKRYKLWVKAAHAGFLTGLIRVPIFYRQQGVTNYAYIHGRSGKRRCFFRFVHLPSFHKFFAWLKWRMCYTTRKRHNSLRSVMTRVVSASWMWRYRIRRVVMINSIAKRTEVSGYVRVTRTNVFITFVAAYSGQTILSLSSGACGFTGKVKRAPHAAKELGLRAGRKLVRIMQQRSVLRRLVRVFRQLKPSIHLYICGFPRSIVYREVFKGLLQSKVQIVSILDYNARAHGGVRGPKARRL